MPSLTVSIINTREWTFLESCLLALFEHPYAKGPFDVIVLNNASRPGSMDPIKERFPQVHIMEESRWRGFGANHNLVAGEASGELLFFLNPDAVVHEGALDRLASALARDPTVALAAGPILNPDGSVWNNPPFPFPSPLQVFGQAVGVHRLPVHRMSPTVAHTFSNGWVSGSAFMVDRGVFSAIGGFDERFFIYSEEIDLMLRLTRGGWKLAWVPDAFVTHVGRTERQTAVDPVQASARRLEDYEARRIVEYIRSKTTYMEKHHGKLGAMTYRLVLGLDALIRLAAAYIPLLWRLLDARGPRRSITRHHHLTRLRAAVTPERLPSLSDLASDWNQGMVASGTEKGQ
jgi:N-acetylglucosaminyl-diphospho-decaprenol L-rhamnosyltransferase